jgi:cytochrome c
MTAPVYVTSSQDYETWLQQQKTAASPTPAPVPGPSPSPTATFQQLATLGKTVYSNSCAVCHGANGQGVVGPALWGSAATLGRYAGTTLFDNNAQAMLSFISKNMPLSAPGSLPHEQYVDVLCFILVQDNQISPANVFNESQLNNMTLK